MQNNVSSLALEIHNSFFCKKLGFKLYRSISKMWELLQIAILQTNSKVAEAH
ncbi:hypothetical protein LEP1GSC021_2799 [Leptospira noguchii str. 1993005606]|nr:hypothetical protein LEP1GSC021_2799 [Leptospira noguchii str. 1993005606]